MFWTQGQLTNKQVQENTDGNLLILSNSSSDKEEDKKDKTQYSEISIIMSD